MTTTQYLHKVHYLVFCSECGLVSVWASQRVATPQRNWHEMQHLEGVMGKQTVVQVQVVPE